MTENNENNNVPISNDSEVTPPGNMPLSVNDNDESEEDKRLKEYASSEIVRANKKLKQDRVGFALFFIAILLCAWLFLPFYTGIEEKVEIYQTVIKNNAGIKNQIKKVKERNNQLSAITKKVNSYQKHVDDLLPKVSELKSIRDSLIKEEEGLQQKKVEYNRNLEDLVKERENLINDKEALSLSVSSFTSANERMGKTVDSLQKRSNALDAEVRNLTQKKSEAEQLIRNIKGLTNQLDSLRKEKTEIDNLLLQKNKLVNEINTNKLSLAALKTENENLNTKKLKAQSLIKNGQKYETNIMALQNTESNLNNAVSDLQKEIQKLSDDKKVLKKIKLQNNIKSLKREVEDLEMKRKALKKSIITLEETKAVQELTIAGSTVTTKKGK